jgi:hypothetical protein
MLTHLPPWEPYHAPLIAFAVALGLAVAGRFLRASLLAAAAGGAGVVAGWYAATGRLWTIAPTASVEELTGLAAITLLIGVLCAWRDLGRLTWIGGLIAALVAGWLLSGAPRHLAALRADWPIGLGVVIAVLVFAQVLAGKTLEPLRLALGALTFAAGLHLVGVPPLWTQLALVPAAAALAMLALPPTPGLAALPVAADIAVLGCLAVIAMGRLSRPGFGAIDAAALSPLLAVWLLPVVTARLRLAGRMAPLAGCLLSAAIAVGCVWLARQFLHR